MNILAIDPGMKYSAYCLWNGERPLAFDKVENERLLRPEILSHLYANCGGITHIFIEMIQSFGMPVGISVHETNIFVGKFMQFLDDIYHVKSYRIYRKTVPAHHCNSVKAKDANIRHAICDRFVPGVRNHGKGTKDNPSIFYGFKTDCWQALALAIYAHDTLEEFGWGNLAIVPFDETNVAK